MKYLNIVALIALLALSACATRGQSGAAIGGAVGAIAGQAIGHNTEGTLIGAGVGTVLGYLIGNEMDKYDRQQLDHMYERGVSNQTSSWVNPDTGYQYAVTPQPAYQQPGSNRWCRKAEIDSWIDGRKETVIATACRNANGQWEIQR